MSEETETPKPADEAGRLDGLVGQHDTDWTEFPRRGQEVNNGVRRFTASASNEVRCILTDREKWLMAQAFKAGYGRGHNDTAESCYNVSCEYDDDCALEWLADMAADAVTVEMVLAKEAPNR